VDRINRASKLPLYHQLYEILRGDILHGKWQPGDMFPPESELVKRYQISRSTVRQVLDMLVNRESFGWSLVVDETHVGWAIDHGHCLPG
jgi:DNA-binding GntR family transcriptional regulator